MTLDLIGDKWSLLILRDMFIGKRRFSDFLASPEGIKRNILTERLKRLEAAGVIRRDRYQERPPRFEYRMTRRGTYLLPVLQAIAQWGNDQFPETWRAPAKLFAWRPEQFFDPSGE